MHELRPDCRFIGNQRTWCEGHDDGGPESPGYIGVDTFGHPLYEPDYPVDPMAGLPARSCNDPEHETERAAVRDAFISDVLLLDQRPEDEPTAAELRADAEHGTPCLVCGAPILNGCGHDECCACGDPFGNPGCDGVVAS